MKKILMLFFLMILYFHSPAAAEVIETGKEIEVKNAAAKSFIYKTLDHWIVKESSDFYHEKYNANQVMMDPPEMSAIRIWIKEVKRKPVLSEYTHIVRIYLPFDGITLNEKTEIKAADTIVLAVNTDFIAFANSNNPHLIAKSVKLMDYDHKDMKK